MQLFIGENGTGKICVMLNKAKKEQAIVIFSTLEIAERFAKNWDVPFSQVGTFEQLLNGVFKNRKEDIFIDDVASFLTSINKKITLISFYTTENQGNLKKFQYRNGNYIPER